MSTRDASKGGSVRIGVACLMLLCSQVVRAQSAATNSSTQPHPEASATPTPASTRPAKVWTNDDMESLHGQPAISTVGSNPQKSASAKTRQSNTDDARAKFYRSEIERLQAELPPIDHQIADLEAALSGDTVSSTRKYYGVKADDWASQLEDLRKRRSEIQARISSIEDDARHKGVPANALP